MVARPKILIVEDENIVRFHLRVTVQELGYTVCGVAATADEALCRAAEDTPHLVLMDIGLPGKRDGIEAARELKARHDLAIVFLTAYADEETVGRAQEIGPDGYVVKPFTKPQLRAALSTAVAGHRHLRRVRDNEFSLASLLADMGEAVIVTDLGGKVTHLNAKAVALTGWSEAEAFDRHVIDIVRVAGHPEAPEREGPTPEGLPPWEAGAIGGMNLRTPDGSRRLVEGEIKPFLGADGTKKGMVIVFREAPERPPREILSTSCQPRPFGARTRMVLFSHDTLGLGHLKRSLNIAHSLTDRFPELSILLLTGSPAVHQYSLPKGVDYIKLPSVRKVGNERYEARSLGLSDADVLDLRRTLALRSIQGFNPHVVLVDHAPLGMGGEMRPALEWLRENRPHCINVLGMRDMVDAPEAVIDHWTKEGTYDVLRDLYDHILIYGSPDIFDAVSAYRFPDELRNKARYCEYVRESGNEDLSPDVDSHLRGDGPVVVVTIGGGDGAGELVIGTYLEMLRRFQSEIRFESILLPGPFLPRDLWARFRAEIQGLPATLLDFVPSTSPFMERADLVVCTGGYNTITQALSVAKKALVIPRVMHRQEQIMRARRLAELDLVTFLHPDDVTAERLHETVTAHLADPTLPLVAAREQSLLPLDGTKMIAEFCRGLTITDSPGSGSTLS